jgi:hypothetical protein
MDDLKIIARVAASQKKLNPTQIGVLEHPDRIRTKTQEKAAEALVELELLEKKQELYDPTSFFYDRTQKGQDYLESLENEKDELTPENISEIADKFSKLPTNVEVLTNIEQLKITLIIRDAMHGNTVVHTVKKVPKNDKEIDKIYNDMIEEIRDRGRKTRRRWKYIPK